MSIFFICGKPGGGKTYLGVAQICEELKDPKSLRYIVTNISLNLPALAEWCHKNCEHEVNLTERIRVLDEAETAEFWKYEPHNEYSKRRVMVVGQGRNRREYDIPDFEDRGDPGTLYVIDEIHVYFGAREWQNTGTDCSWFLTQHRKLGCDVVFITQHPDQCDKALRRLAQEFMTVRNLSREPILGFRLGSLFRYIRSLHPPTSPNFAPFESGYVKLKPEEIGKLYDTNAGVGIAGRVTTSKKNQKRGRSVWWIAVPVVGAVLLIVFMPRIISSWVTLARVKMTNKMTSTNTLTKAAGNFFQPQKPTKTETPQTLHPQGYDVVTKKKAEIERWFCVMAKGKLDWSAVLTDGTVHTRYTSKLDKVTPYGCIINGEYLYFRHIAQHAQEQQPTRELVVPLDSGEAISYTNGVVRNNRQKDGKQSEQAPTPYVILP